MSSAEPTVTYLELRASTASGEAQGGLSHKAGGLVLLHVQELAAAGEPRGAVTIVHDAGEHGGRYLDVGRALAAAGWAVALPDLRGHGRSEGARGHSNGLIEVLRDLADVQDHLAYRQPEAPKVLVGHGLGALWCLAHACERPQEVAALVLVAPLLEPHFELPKAGGGVLGFLRQTSPESPGRLGWSAAQLTSDPAEQAARAGDALVHDVITLRAGQEAAAAAARYRGRIGQLELPVLVLHGSADPLAACDASRSLSAPRLELLVIEGALHDPLHGRGSVATLAALARWLERAVRT